MLTITTDFYSISLLSNKLELFISRAINQLILTGEIEVILPALEEHRIIIAMHVYILHSEVLYNQFVHFTLFRISFTVLILYGVILYYS